MGSCSLKKRFQWIPMDSNAFPAFSIFHSSMKYYDIYLSYCARVQRVLKASSSLSFVSMPNCFPGLRWCSENLGSGSPHLFGAWIRRRLLQLGQSRREVSWCLVISAQWVDLHQYWVSQDSKDFQSEQMRIRYPQNSTYLHNLEDAKKTYPNMSICETTEFCGRPDF